MENQFYVGKQRRQVLCVTFAFLASAFTGLWFVMFNGKVSLTRSRTSGGSLTFFLPRVNLSTKLCKCQLELKDQRMILILTHRAQSVPQTTCGKQSECREIHQIQAQSHQGESLFLSETNNHQFCCCSFLNVLMLSPGLLFHYQLTMWRVCLTNDPLLSLSLMFKWLHTPIISSCCAV